jgi:hypothetical protein
MIHACPFCGCLVQTLIDGLASCPKCSRVFTNTLFTRLLSASWLVRNNTYHGIEELISDTKISEPEAIFVYSFIAENLYSHDEFLRVLKAFKID